MAKKLSPVPFRNPPPLEGWDKLGYGVLTAAVVTLMVGAFVSLIAAFIVGIWVDGDLCWQIGGTAIVCGISGLVLGQAL